MESKKEMDMMSELGAEDIAFEASASRTFKLKSKGEDELRFAKWWIFGGYGKKKSLAFGEAFVFIPHESLGKESKLVKFTVYKSKKDKHSGSHDFQVWVSSSPNPSAVDNLNIMPHKNGILVANVSTARDDSTRFFEITVETASGMRNLDPELKIKKKDMR